MALRFTFRRNADKGLPATHTFEGPVHAGDGFRRRRHLKRSGHPDEAGGDDARGGRSPVSLSRSSPAVSTIVDHGISKLISRHAKLKLYRYEVLTYLCIWTYLLLERRGANQEGQIMQELPAPWCVEKIAGGFRVRDGNGRPIVWVYGQENPIRPDVMTLGEAKAMALRIAMLAELRRESEDFHVQAASLQQAAA